MPIFNIPNSITLFRALLLIPFAIYLREGKLPLALACFGTLVALDKLDGISARLMHQKTRLGEIFDSTTDWVSLLLAFSLGIFYGYIDAFFVPYLVASFLFVALAKILYASRTKDTQSTWAGKLNIGLAYIAVLSYLIQFPYQNALFFGCILGTTLTGAYFLLKAAGISSQIQNFFMRREETIKKPRKRKR